MFDALTPHQKRLLAVTACVDPRTLAKYEQGRTYSTTTARIERALKELGLDHLRRREDQREAS